MKVTLDFTPRWLKWVLEHVFNFCEWLVMEEWY